MVITAVPERICPETEEGTDLPAAHRPAVGAVPGIRQGQQHVGEVFLLVGQLFPVDFILDFQYGKLVGRGGASPAPFVQFLGLFVHGIFSDLHPVLGQLLADGVFHLDHLGQFPLELFIVIHEFGQPFRVDPIVRPVVGQFRLFVQLFIVIIDVIK